MARSRGRLPTLERTLEKFTRWPRWKPVATAAAGMRDLLWPPACAACGADESWSGTGLCRTCHPPDSAMVCVTESGERGDPLRFCWAAAAYRGDVEDWVRRFKYPDPGILGLDPGPATAVCALITAVARRAPGPQPSRVVPVPLHPRRLRQRGFNPAAVLARRVARLRGIRFDADSLRRIRDTPTQTGLGQRARQANVRGAFVASRSLSGCVWLVDDVVTTGATLAACARALRLGGAVEVSALCAAHTPTPVRGPMRSGSTLSGRPSPR